MAARSPDRVFVLVNLFKIMVIPFLLFDTPISIVGRINLGTEI